MSHIAAPVLSALPADWRNALLLGRVDLGEGPTPILVSRGDVFDMSRVAPTVSALVAGSHFSNYPKGFCKDWITSDPDFFLAKRL